MLSINSLEAKKIIPIMYVNANPNIPFKAHRLSSIYPLGDKIALWRSHGKNHSERQ